MYLRMKRIREFETKAQGMFAEGKIPGFVHLYLGEEAVATGVCECLRDDDYITSTHRGHGHIIAKGGDLKFMMNLCLTADHRVIDGVMASKFLQRLTELLENPFMLLA